MSIVAKRKEPELDRHELSVSKDLEWRTYVGGLEPDDVTGAFLLPEELPEESSSRYEVRDAIETASRRALWPDRMAWVRDHVMGTITGVMRVMCPQGRDYEHEFQNEQGWRATIVVEDEEKEESFVAYYRSSCMNPITSIFEAGGRVDVSSVQFTPATNGETHKATDTGETSKAFYRNLERLAAEYNLERLKRMHELLREQIAERNRSSIGKRP